MDQNLSTQLSTLLQALINSVLLLYKSNTLQIKLAGLLVLAYIAYKLGRITIVDPLQSQAEQMKLTIRNRQQYTIYLPKKINKMKNIRKTLLAFVFIIAATGGALYYIQHEFIMNRTSQELQIAGLGLLVLFASSVVLWIYQSILSYQVSRGGFNDRIVHQKLAHILNALGKKSELVLKGFLCRQKYMKNKRPTSQNCSKDKCKQYRLLLKNKADDITRMVDGVLNFQWCSICKKKGVFDQFLNFQSKGFHKAQGSSEEKEVTERNNYLLSQLERMTGWVSEISPCNCSRRYWSESTKQIVQFKKRDKILSQKLIDFERSDKNYIK